MCSLSWSKPINTMADHIVLFLVLLSAMAYIEASQEEGGCPIGYTAFGSYCYGYVNEKMTWTDAQSTCAALGGFLAEVLTEDQGRFLHDFAEDHDSHSIWLGAEDLLQEGLWMWVHSGQLVKDHYTDWQLGKPEDVAIENCLEMNFKQYQGKWNDDECDDTHRFVCQRYPGSTVTVG